jgi:hypothetical protein
MISDNEEEYVDKKLIELYSNLEINKNNLEKQMPYTNKEILNKVKKLKELQKSKIDLKDRIKQSREVKLQIMKNKYINTLLSSEVTLNDDSSRDYVIKINEITELLGRNKLRDTKHEITDGEMAYFNQILVNYYKNDFLYFWYCHYIPLKISKSTLHILKYRLEFSSIPNFPQFELYKNGFIRMLEKLNEEKLKEFHIYWTGTDIIQKKYECLFLSMEDTEYMRSHTCFNRIDISIVNKDRSTNKEVNEFYNSI